MFLKLANSDTENGIKNQKCPLGGNVYCTAKTVKLLELEKVRLKGTRITWP